VSWHPANPAQGAFVQIVVEVTEPQTVRGVHGHLAGQALRFEPARTGAFLALGGIPVGAAASIPVTVEVEDRSGEIRYRTVRIPVTPGDFPIERLTVAPRFTAPPDSALAARIADERAQTGGVWEEASRTPRLWRGPFVRPVEGRITSPYGGGREFNGEIQSRHMGVDLDGEPGTPVAAANRGVVALAADQYYAGRVVYVNHGDGLATAYMHLSEILVAQGDTVETGTLVGRVGATGRVTGPHLHWHARFGRLSLNAMTLLDLRVELQSP
jgi:murein DD-endopeptidase MepM/ murein hydrolase activator NlpD